MIRRLLKVFLGVLMLPASYAVALNLFRQISLISSLGGGQNYFFYGIVAYTAMHIVFFRPVYIYVFGHEVLHVLATWLCGGKVTSFKVSRTGGSVETTKANFFVALAPYLFPFYTIIISLIYGGLSFFFDTAAYAGFFVFLLGFSLALHLIMTIEMIKKKQDDIARTGYLFSVNLIFICNLVVFGLILSLLFSEVSFADFGIHTAVETREIWRRIYVQMFCC